jgi:hypothetical protein
MTSATGEGGPTGRQSGTYPLLLMPPTGEEGVADIPPPLLLLLPKLLSPEKDTRGCGEEALIPAVCSLLL